MTVSCEPLMIESRVTPQGSHVTSGVRPLETSHCSRPDGKVFDQE